MLDSMMSGVGMGGIKSGAGEVGGGFSELAKL